MTSIILRDVSVDHDNHRVIDGLNLTVDSGERVALLGPSGCGKTTILRVIAGLDQVAEGRVLLGERDVTGLHPRDRNIAMVNQEASLQPHLNVERNLGFALRLRKVPQEQIDERVEAESRAFSLKDLLRRRPKTLSGGERHEVALARSLVRRSSVLLMDEPFSKIDPVRRGILLRELIQVQEGYGVTLLIATNDQRVALGLAERIAVIEKGRLVQVGSPNEVYNEPASTFAAGFIGSPPMNLIDGIVTRLDGQVHVQAGPLSLPTWNTALTSYLGAPVTLGIRPQDVQVDPSPRGAVLRLQVVRREFMGKEVTVHLATGSGLHLTATVPHPGPDLDGRVGVTILPAEVHLFDPVAGTLITHGV
ncbi:MAG: ABC transporter ATP-binding protein [Nitriliruptor sp.]|nr:MAG: ABC transporter ATP-binding protein [Nitriliruptor sp.]